jgi:apolipoprotein D and lipocalin family protein
VIQNPRRAALGAALACVLVGVGVGTAVAHDPLPTVPHVDLPRYAGEWHEIARLPNAFQRNCVRSKAMYRACGDGSIAVVNTCSTTRGRCRSVEGRAEPVPGSGNARLRVRFAGMAALAPVPLEGNYWIIALDDEYRWAMVGTPDRRFLWILAREPWLPEDVYRMLVDRARCLGFDVSRLVR